MSNSNITVVNNIDDVSIDYQDYKKLMRPISDIISVLWDVTNNVMDTVTTESRFKKAIYGYCQETLQDKNTLLYKIIVNCIKSYNKYKKSPNSFNNSIETVYPVLNAENVDNEKLRTNIEDILYNFSWYISIVHYHGSENINIDEEYLEGFQTYVHNLCITIYDYPSKYGLSVELLNAIPDLLKHSVILDIVAHSVNNNNNTNNNSSNNGGPNNEWHNEESYNEYNTLPNNNTHTNINSYTSNINTKNVKQCYDPLMATNKNISDDDLILYISNKENKIVKAMCIDEDSFDGMLKNDEMIFYQCKPSVPQSALFIQPKDVFPTRLRRLATDIVVYVYENQAKKIELGKKYILVPTDIQVGRIASYPTVRGNSVVSAEHCQNNYSNEFIYEIKEYGTNGGKRSTNKRSTNKRKTRKQKKSINVTRRYRKQRKL
jgi:hypothetical protein